MNKVYSDDLEIEGNVINYNTDEQAKDLSKKILDLVGLYLSPSKYSTESVASAIELINQMHLDDELLKNFAEHIKQKLQEGPCSLEDVSVAKLLMKNNFSDVIGDWYDSSFLPSSHQIELVVKLIAEKCVKEQIIKQKANHIKSMLDSMNYTKEIVISTMHLVRSNTKRWQIKRCLRSFTDQKAFRCAPCPFLEAILCIHFL